jgi:hypothetical protein
MKLHVWNIGRSKFDNVPEAERTFIIGLGHIENEINVLQKILYWTAPSEQEPEIIRRAHSSQATPVAKLLAGKLWEAWQFLHNAYFKTRVSANYYNVLNVEGKDAINSLKQYFKRNNIVSTVRNKFAFHYSVEHIREGFSLPPDTDDWQIVLSESSENNLYYLADLVANYAMLNSIDQKDYWKAMDRLLKELTEISRWFIIFGDACWIIVIEKYLRDTRVGIPVQEVNLEDCSTINEVEIPFFIEPERLTNT